MVFYDVILKNNTVNNLVFESQNQTYNSFQTVDYFPTTYLFNNKTDFFSNTLINYEPGNPFGFATWQGPNTRFPPEPTIFKIGDCIRIFNDASQDGLLAVNAASTSIIIVDTYTLPPNEEVFLLWLGENSRFSTKPCCVHPDTMVKTSKGFKKISDIRKGEYVIDNNNKRVKVLMNIKNVSVAHMAKIKAGSCGENMPSFDLLIRNEHPVLIDNVEILAKNVRGIQQIKLEKMEHVYTLVTKDECFVNMNEIPVKTYSLKGWNTRVRKTPNMVYWSL
jgi:hypothetical protein